MDYVPYYNDKVAALNIHKKMPKIAKDQGFHM